MSVLRRLGAAAVDAIGHNGGPSVRSLLDTVDLPPGSDPRYVGAAPDRAPGSFQRYVPARGSSARTQRLRGMLEDVNSPINQTIDQYVQRGIGLGGPDWYNTEELRDWFIGVLGEAEGDARWREYIDLIGATSATSAVPPNLRNASFYYVLSPEDRARVAERVSQGGITPGDAARELGIDVPNMPDDYRYGHIAQRLQANNVLSQIAGEWSRDVPEGLTGSALSRWLQANPKVKGFANDLLGDRQNIAADKHFMRMLAMADGGVDFLSDQAQLSAENLALLREAYGAAIDPYVRTRLTRTGQPITHVNLRRAGADGVISDTSMFRSMPTAWEDTPNDNEYAALEELAGMAAERFGMTPAQFQASLWMGAGDLTGLADESQGTAMQLFRNVLDNRAQQLGTDRRGLLEMFINRQAPLAVPMGVGLLGLAGTQEAQAATPGASGIEEYLRSIGGQ